MSFPGKEKQENEEDMFVKLWESRKKNQENEGAGEPDREKKVIKGIKGILGAVIRSVGRFIKKHKILTVLIVLILTAAIAASVIWQSRSRRPQMEQAPAVETATIERMDLMNSIGVTGTLATAQGKSGSTTLENVEVTAVYVEVGDEVQEGDIICTFDSSDIESALADARNNYAVNQQLNALDNYETQYAETIEEAEESLQNARDTRDAYKNAYTNAVSAEEDALNALNEAQSQYDMDALKSAYDTAAAALKSAIESTAEITITDLDSYISTVSSENNGALPGDYTELKAAYDTAKSAYESAQQAVSQAQSAYEQAQAASASAYSAYEQAQSQKESVQEQYDAAVEQAQETYERAQLEDQIVTEDDGLKQIEKYEEQLEDCTVYASMTGTITALNVEEGGIFTGGTIYEIQDVHNFIVEAVVDEYDVVNIEKGQTAYIVTDSLGDEELEGEVTYVSPVGTSGQTMGSASGTASYEIQITINEPQDKLRSGMTASVSIALEESKDTLAVPYDCVQTSENGESVIYVDDNGERKEVVVETGIETDYYIEVSSDEISEGMTVYLSTPLVQSSGGTGEGTDADAGTEEGTMTFDFGGNGGGRGSMPSGEGGGMGGGPGGGGAPGGF